MSATAGCGKSIMSLIIGEDQISLQQRVGTKERLNSLWHSITGACNLHRQKIKKSRAVMTISFLPMLSGCTITAPHIRLHMHGNILLSSGLVVQRHRLGTVWATTCAYFMELVKFRFTQTSELCQNCSAPAWVDGSSVGHSTVTTQEDKEPAEGSLITGNWQGLSLAVWPYSTSLHLYRK